MILHAFLYLFTCHYEVVIFPNQWWWAYIHTTEERNSTVTTKLIFSVQGIHLAQILHDPKKICSRVAHQLIDLAFFTKMDISLFGAYFVLDKG